MSVLLTARRLARELTTRIRPEHADAIVGSLGAEVGSVGTSEAEALGAPLREGQRVARIVRDAREPGIPDDVDVVVFGAQVYASVPTRDARIVLLGRARRAARTAVVVNAELTDEGSHAARLVIDGARRVLAALGLPVAEPGDRFEGDRFVHRFFDEEALLGEAREAGLMLASRHGPSFVLVAGRPAAEALAPFATELRRVVATVRDVDRLRLTRPPAEAIAAAREAGRREHARGVVGRARLRRAIGWADAAMPGGASCYRRTLLELSLDASAAGETIVFGLDVGRTGHVAFAGREERSFDVAFAIGPDATPDTAKDATSLRH